MVAVERKTQVDNEFEDEIDDDTGPKLFDRIDDFIASLADD